MVDVPQNYSVNPELNSYQQKKNLAEGLMDIALLSANANQLRYVLQFYNGQPFQMLAISFITASLAMQAIVGIGLIMNSRYNMAEHEDHQCANRVNDWTVAGIFLITIINVFVASFGIPQSDEGILRSSTQTPAFAEEPDG